jgi:uncharacterized membrane protein YdbT with pleckstrin-like domain
MADGMDEVIAEVAAKHGILIGCDDPILVLHTINDRLLRENAAAQQALLDAYKEELEASASRWHTDATARADRILHAAVTGSKETMIALMQQGAITAAASVRSEVDAALARVTIRLQDARRIAVLNVVAACITLVAAGIVVWSRLPSG